MPEQSNDESEGVVGLHRVPAPAVYGGIAFFVTLFAVYHQSSVIATQHTSDIANWLKESGLSRFQKLLTVHNEFDGQIGLASLVNEDGEFSIEILNGVFEKLGAGDVEILGNEFLQLKNDLILRKWLSENSIPDHHWKYLRSVGITSLSVLTEKCHSSRDILLGDLTKQNTEALFKACEKLLSKNGLTKTLQYLWNNVQRENKSSWGLFSAIIISALISVLVGMAATMSQPSFFLDHSTATKLGFLTFVTGKYLAPQNCKLEFFWKEPQVVGSTVKFVIRFFQRNGRVYPISNKDNLLVEITQGSHKIACSTELGGTDVNDVNKACVKFSVRRAGDYTISVLVGMVHIRGSPFTKHFLSGPPDPQKTGFVHHCSTVVCTESVPYHLFIEPRDKYGNVCATEATSDPSDEYTVDVVEINSERPIPSPFRWECHPHLSRISLVLKLEQEGIYRALVSFRGVSLQNGDFDIIVLNKADGALVQKNVAKKSHNIWYEAKLLSKNGDNLGKPRKVFCYVSPKQLTIKEYVLKIIPKRLITFRLCPSTKFQFKSSNNQYTDEILVIDDGCQPQVELLTPDRSVIAATFTQFLLKNIGGSETFKDKQDFFYHEVRKLHQKHFHDKLPLKVQRDRLLESSMKTMKGFGTSDWCKNFEITFIGEQGLDWGGLRREWFELICSNLFDPEYQLFQRFKNDKQGLVHPNPKRPAHLKLKHFEFSGRIVGKCLYESALGSSYRQLVKGRFSRSFLAQLIGLRVHYKYFEQDDPDLYVSKIKYILENDVSQMELFFVEEEYGPNGQLLRVIELIPNGANIAVTNQNKHRYLDVLAQHRLANNVKDEVEAFLKGLNELIPDNLLCIFDENELELLMCGTGQYSIADFKANHAVSGASYEFRKILDWFWTAVSNFTEEEMARLLQFTTGCSQLPPGGFGELNPRFHITAAPTFGNLPTAHTCFNQLCLPDYDSYEQFERALRLSVNEGSEGFGMV